MILKTDLAPLPRLAVPQGTEVPGLQALKLLCAFLVVVIHTSALQPTLLRGTASVAVPVFFMITGFFLVDARGCIDCARVGRMLVKLLKLTVMAQLFFMAWEAALLTVNGEPTDVFLNPRSWVTTLLTGDKWGGHLWYLTAALQALAVVWVAARFRVTRLLYLAVPAGILLGLLTGAYAPLTPLADLVPHERFIYRGFFTMALPFIMLGVALRRRPGLTAGTSAWMWGLVALLLAAQAVEWQWFRMTSWGDLTLFTLPAAAALFVAAAGSAFPRQVVRAGRRLSTGIYIFHLAVMEALVVMVAPLADSILLAPATFLVTALVVDGAMRVGRGAPQRVAR